MAAPILSGRRFFRASGQVNWVRMIPWGALAFAVGAVLALIMALLFWVGFYLVVIVPFAVGEAAAGLVLLAVSRGHCRNRLLAGAFGALLGLFVYLGYYYISMVHDIGLENAAQIDFLPRYILLRIQTDQVHDVGQPDDQPDKSPHPERKYGNAVFFVIEFGFLVFLPCGMGFRRAGRAYCEKCQLWMKRETSSFKPELGPGFVEALRLGSVQSLAALFTSPPKPSVPNTAVALDCCVNLKEGRTKDCPVYLSVKQVVQTAKGLKLDTFEMSKGKLLLWQVLIGPGEMPALLARFTSLEPATGTTAAQVLEGLHVEIPNARDRVTVEVKPVDPQFAGRILTKKNAYIRTAIGLAVVVVFFGSIAIGVLGGFMAFPDHPPMGGVPPVIKIVGVMLIALAVTIFAANLVMLFFASDFFSARFARRVVLREFGRRPSHLVSPQDPDSVLVEIIPRSHWGVPKLIDAIDTGFLRVDRQKGELYFEGDREVYRIPAAAITSCEIETHVIGQGTHGATTVYRTVLQANHPAGFWEVPFAELGNSGKFRRKSRLRWAQELQRQISELWQGASDQTSLG